MPTYEYKCDKCGIVFEAFQSITAAPLDTCTSPGCGGAVRRLFSAGAGFLFKGAGFYATDYRSDSYRKAAKAESGASSAPSTDKKSSGGGDGATKSASSTGNSPSSSSSDT